MVFRGVLQLEFFCHELGLTVGSRLLLRIVQTLGYLLSKPPKESDTKLPRKKFSSVFMAENGIGLWGKSGVERSRCYLEKFFWEKPRAGQEAPRSQFRPRKS